jgi:nitroreductase
VNQSPGAYRHVLSLRVVRRFRPDPIPAEEMTAVLEAGRWTGSSKNRQGWAFIVVDDREGLERLATAGSFTAPVLASAASVVLVRLPGGNDFDIGRVAQNMMLAAAARGLGSCPITLHRREQAREVLALPDHHEATWAIALGYPDEEAEPEQRRLAAAAGFTGRRPLADLVHHGRFGETAS